MKSCAIRNDSKPEILNTKSVVAARVAIVPRVGISWSDDLPTPGVIILRPDCCVSMVWSNLHSWASKVLHSRVALQNFKKKGRHKQTYIVEMRRRAMIFTCFHRLTLRTSSCFVIASWTCEQNWENKKIIQVSWTLHRRMNFSRSSWPLNEEEPSVAAVWPAAHGLGLLQKPHQAPPQRHLPPHHTTVRTTSRH